MKRLTASEHYAQTKAGNKMTEEIRAAMEKAWEEGHNHCFHVENPHNKERNPYKVIRTEEEFQALLQELRESE